MNTVERVGIRRRPLTVVVPLIGRLPAYSPRAGRGDLVAGLAVAAVLVPGSMAHGQVAGLSPAAGLYTALGAMVAYALFTSTRVVAVGPSGVMAIMTFTAVHGIVRLQDRVPDESFTTTESASVVSHVVAKTASQPWLHEPTSGTTAWCRYAGGRVVPSGQ